MKANELRILNEVKRLYKEESHNTASTVLHKLIDFINSLPEVPTNKAWHDPKNKPVENIWHDISELPAARDCEYLLVIYKDSTSPDVAGNKTQVSYWDRVDKWCYLNDLLHKKGEEV